MLDEDKNNKNFKKGSTIYKNVLNVSKPSVPAAVVVQVNTTFWAGDTVQVSTRLLGRRTALLPTFVHSSPRLA